MEEIRKFVEGMITTAGVTGAAVPVIRHIMLTITAILLAMLSDFLCRKILVPIILKITEKTEVTWDDVLFNKKVLTSACHIVPAVVIWKLMPLVYLEYPIFKMILERATGIYIVVMTVRTMLVFIGSFKGLENGNERRSSAGPDDALCRSGCHIGCLDVGVQGYHPRSCRWYPPHQQ